MDFKIVLMDESPHIQKTLCYFLHSYNPLIHPFHSANQFPESVKKISPDLILIDSGQLENKNQLSAFMKEESSPPVVLLSRDKEILKIKQSIKVN